MKLYEEWCDLKEEALNLKRYLHLAERPGGREIIIKALSKTVRSHYDLLDRIADDIRILGFEVASAILRELLPITIRARAGDLGEILASELTEEVLGFEVPVRRMRFKDGREVPMRGDDFIGVNFCADDGGLWLLKGEAKSRARLDRATVAEARSTLRRDHGRCTPTSLLFVASQLLDSDDPDRVALGRRIRNEVGLKALGRDRIDHALFTLSGNGPVDALKDDYNAAEAGRHQAVINLHIEDYRDFIREVYEQATDLGDG